MLIVINESNGQVRNGGRYVTRFGPPSFHVICILPMCFMDHPCVVLMIIGSRPMLVRFGRSICAHGATGAAVVAVMKQATIEFSVKP